MNNARHQESRHRSPLLIIGLSVGFLVLVAGGIFGALRLLQPGPTSEGTVTITARHWVRQIEVEQYRTFTEGNWILPIGSHRLSTQTRISSYQTVHDGWRSEQYTDYVTRSRIETYATVETRYRTETYTYGCSTTGYSNGKTTTVYKTCTGIRSTPYIVPVVKTRSVSYQVPVQRTRRIEITHQRPIYAAWYTYQINRWVSSRWVAASDATSELVAWPVVTDLRRITAPDPRVGDERVGSGRTAIYTTMYIDQKHITRSLKSTRMALWSKLLTGKKVSARYYTDGGQLASVNWHKITE